MYCKLSVRPRLSVNLRENLCTLIHRHFFILSTLLYSIQGRMCFCISPVDVVVPVILFFADRDEHTVGLGVCWAQIGKGERVEKSEKKNDSRGEAHWTPPIYNPDSFRSTAKEREQTKREIGRWERWRERGWSNRNRTERGINKDLDFSISFKEELQWFST